MEEYQQLNISVIDPITDAIERTKFILFSPFDIGKWFTIGFCAFLAFLGDAKFNGGGSHGNRENSQNLQNAFSTQLPLILTIIAFVIVICIVIGALFCWLSSRGRFMFLHCVAKNVAEIKVPWSAYKNQANSLFLFRISVAIIMMLIVAIIGGGIFLSALLIHGGAQVALGVVLIVFLVMGLLSVVLTSALTLKFTKDFVVPIMYLHRCTCVEGWKFFMPLLTSNKGNFTLYILFQIVINMAVATMLILLVVFTCCIAGCIMIIPYIGAVFTLPLTVFLRSYSLYYFRQYSSQYNVFEDSQQVLYD